MLRIFALSFKTITIVGVQEGAVETVMCKYDQKGEEGEKGKRLGFGRIAIIPWS